MTTRTDIQKHVRSWNRADQIEAAAIRVLWAITIIALLYEAVRRMP